MVIDGSDANRASMNRYGSVTGRIPRPMSIKAAIGLMAVSSGLGVVKMAIGAHLENPLTYLARDRRDGFW